MLLLARIAFWRCAAYSPRDRALAWSYMHFGKRWRRAILTLGAERNG